jgi:hypothetical protein
VVAKDLVRTVENPFAAASEKIYSFVLNIHFRSWTWSDKKTESLVNRNSGWCPNENASKLKSVLD